jgi:ribose/xylose/arabinose/galactoside ABC-type transport system permease subunit
LQLPLSRFSFSTTSKVYKLARLDHPVTGPSGLNQRARRLAVLSVRYGTFIGLALWLVAMACSSDYFLTTINLLNVARQTAPIIIIGVGSTFVMATAGIDLSVGAIVALVSSAWLADGLTASLVVIAVIAVGACLGALNGFLVWLGIPAFIVTLGGLVSIRGIAFVYSNGYATPITNPAILWLGRGAVLGVDAPILIALLVVVAGVFTLSRSQLGLHALAVGGREEAARVMGLPIGRIKILVYGISGALAALGGLVLAARLSNGSPNAGMGLELDVISAVVLGGTSLFGGSATIIGTIIGALFIGFIRNGLNLLDVNPYWVQVVTGIVLVAAVLLNTIVNRRVEQWARVSATDE